MRHLRQALFDVTDAPGTPDLGPVLGVWPPEADLVDPVALVDQTTRQAEWSAYSLAAQSLASQSLEQSRAAKWDPKGYPATDQLVSSNFPLKVQILDIPMTGSNIVYATNITSISTVSVNPPLKMISVECIWRFLERGLFTNTVVSYRAPDQ